MFVEKLNELMNERNLTKAQLIRATGITEGAIDGWRKKGTQPTAENICRLADFFACTTDELLGRENFGTGIVEIQGVQLSELENKVVTCLRMLSLQDQYQVLGFAQALAR